FLPLPEKFQSKRLCNVRATSASLTPHTERAVSAQGSATLVGPLLALILLRKENLPSFVLCSDGNRKVTLQNVPTFTPTGRLLQRWQKICQLAANFLPSAFVG